MSEIAEQNKKRTKTFSRGCIKMLSQSKLSGKLYWHIEGQLYRCSTSVAANYRAACLAQSDKAFVAKLSIVIEEADESAFWIEILQEENLINTELSQSLLMEANELTRMFVAARKTLNNRNF